MRDRPDFDNQVADVESRLVEQWKSVQEVWQDCSADSFDYGIMKPYMGNFQRYRYNLELLMNRMDRLMDQMENIMHKRL